MRISDWSSDVCSSDLAEAVHGLSIQFLSDKPLFASCIDDLLAFLGDAAMVAHNAAFDFGFVNAELARAGRPALDMVRMCCTVQMARKLHPGAKHSLDALCARYGIDRSHRVKHGDRKSTRLNSSH